MATPGTPGDPLTFATVRWRVDNRNLSLEQQHMIGLDQRIQGKRGAGFALTPAAVTAMDEQWFRRHAKAHEAACAAAIGEAGLGAHRVMLLANLI
jgi:hypothetical protein